MSNCFASFFSSLFSLFLLMSILIAICCFPREKRKSSQLANDPATNYNECNAFHSFCTIMMVSIALIPMRFLAMHVLSVG